MKVKCLIVDDEPLARDVIKTYVEWLEGLELVGSCGNAIEALSLLQKKRVDLIFLDIRMPRISGIDFLKSLPNPPKVIFTTAFRDYALEGYELDVVDYLLKPIAFDRFMKAVNKVFRLSPQASTSPQNPVVLSPQDAFIYLKADKKMVKVFLKDILYIESLKDYVRVKTIDKQVVTYQKISFLAERLPEDRFLRVHRSFIVAIDKVDAYSASFIELAGKNIPIGRNYKNEVMSTLNKYDWLTDTQ